MSCQVTPTITVMSSQYSPKIVSKRVSTYDSLSKIIRNTKLFILPTGGGSGTGHWLPGDAEPGAEA